MFRADGTPVLIDFGAARQAIGVKSESLTQILTPGYAPKEQYSRKGKVGPWSDIYSLAAVAYTCLTGKVPDDASDRVMDDDYQALAKGATASAFFKAIDEGLNVRPQDRPQDLADWYAAWGEAGASKSTPDVSVLDDTLAMAGADKVITPNEMELLLKRATEAGIATKEALNHITAVAQAKGWEIVGSEPDLQQKKASRKRASAAGNLTTPSAKRNVDSSSKATPAVAEKRSPFGQFWHVLRNVAVFRGRASRSEYWSFSLINILVLAAVAGVEEFYTGWTTPIGPTYMLVIFLPTLSVTVRRFHDIGQSGWAALFVVLQMCFTVLLTLAFNPWDWVYLFLVSLFIGPMVMLIFASEAEHPSANNCGPNPLDATSIKPSNKTLKINAVIVSIIITVGAMWSYSQAQP